MWCGRPRPRLNVTPKMLRSCAPPGRARRPSPHRHLRASTRAAAAHTLIATAVTHHDRSAEAARRRGRPRPRISRIQASTLWLKWPAAPLFRLLEAVLSERNTLLDANSLRRIRQLLAPDGAWQPHRPVADILSAAPETPGSVCSARR